MLQQAIERTDRGTMSEMRNYSKPPQAVHDVLTAALLLLGDHEDATKVSFRGCCLTFRLHLSSKNGDCGIVIVFVTFSVVDRCTSQMW